MRSGAEAVQTGTIMAKVSDLPVIIIHRRINIEGRHNYEEQT